MKRIALSAYLGPIVIGIVLAIAASVTHAQDSIAYPISELGNCGSRAECRAYCDDLAHVRECIDFSEARGLMNADEIREAREFAKLGSKGPGDCTSKKSCEAYCENIAHIEECIAFAESHGFMSEEDLDEARRIARALLEGVELPGGCTSKSSCETYCEDPAHMRQCLSFAKNAGFMDGEELAEAEKVAVYLESGGSMPGSCRGERECKAYCESGDHMEECAEFAIKAGFMSEKEAEMFRKTGGKGPGGCRGRQCESYCEDASHREECIAFALEHDLMSEEDKRRMEEGRSETLRMLSNAPAAVLKCLENAMGIEAVQKVKDGGFVSPRFGEVIPQCFREVMGGQGTGPFGAGVPPATVECMRKIFGDDFEAGMRTGAIDPGARDDEIRECMREHMGEGFLNDEGVWERPQNGEMPYDSSAPNPARSYPGERFMGEEAFGGPQESGEDFMRREFELRMRAEIETRIREGNITPEDMQRYRMYQYQSPDGIPYGEPPHSEGALPDGLLAPPPYPMRPEGYYIPPEEGQLQILPQAPVSMMNPLVANVLIMIRQLLGH